MLTLKEKKLVKEYAKKIAMKKQSSSTTKKKKLVEANGDEMTRVEVYDSINWDLVGKEILKKFHINTKLSFRLGGNAGREYPVMESDNIIKQCGIFKYAIGECYLTFFNAQLNTDSSSKIKFWGTINFDYPGNGMRIGQIVIDNNGKITVDTDAPRHN